MEGFLLLVIAGLAVLVILLWARVADLSRDFRELTSELRRLSPEAERRSPARAEKPAAPLPAPPPAPPPAPRPARPAAPPAASPKQPPSFGPPTRTQGWEALIGEKWLNRIGALALIIGIAFFLRHAFEQNWITPPIRVLLGGGAGLALVYFASIRRPAYPVFAQGVLGAGISVLYLSAFASFNLYGLVPQSLAFLLMAAVTALAFERALRFDSLAVALLGWAGGFLTPALLWSSAPGASRAGGLFLYVLLLDVGLLALVLVRRRWWIVEPLSLGASYLTYLIWHTTTFESGDFAAALTFVTLLWALFLVVDLRRFLVGDEARPVFGRFLASLNGTFFYAALLVLVDGRYPGNTGLATLALAAAYLAPSVWARKSLAPYTLKALVLVAVGTGLEGEGGLLTVSLWGAEAVLLLGVGVGARIRHLRLAALGFYGLATLGLLFTEGSLAFEPLRDFLVLTNPRAITFVVVAGATALGAMLYKSRQTGETSWAPLTLNYLWSAILFALVTVEINDYFRQELLGALGDQATSLVFNRALTLALAWTALGLLLLWYGRVTNLPAVAFTGLGALALGAFVAAARGLVFEPEESFRLFLNYRLLVLAAVITSTWATGVILRGSGYPGLPIIQTAGRVALAVLVFVLITGETRDFFEQRIAEVTAGGPARPFDFSPQPVPPEVERLKDQQQLALSTAWLAYSFVAMTIGIWRRLLSFRIAAMALFGVTVVKVFLVDLSFLSALYRTISFMALGVILLVVSFLYQRYRSVLFPAA